MRIENDKYLSLPEELLRELTPSTASITPVLTKNDRILLSIFTEAATPISINDILIGWYKQTGTVKKRLSMHAEIHRIKKKGLIVKIEPCFFAIATAK